MPSEPQPFTTRTRQAQMGGPLLALARAMVRGGWASHDLELIEAGRELEARAQAILASEGRLPVVHHTEG